MRTQGCQRPAGVLMVVFAIFLLHACGGGSGGGTTPTPKVPTITAVSPSSATAGAAGVTLTVTGLNYVSDAHVSWNGVSLPTTFVSATELRATLGGSQLADAATVTITVVNPGSGGGTSSGFTFVVNNPVPAVARVTPSWAPAGNSGTTISVDGSGFSHGSQIRWNGTALTTTYVSGSRLTASVPASSVASAGTANVTVFNPSPGGGTSSALAFAVLASGPNHVTRLSMDVAGMAWDASRGQIYATLPSTAANGNSLITIDPLTGGTSTPVPVGNNPNLLALSSDAAHLWVSLDGDNAVQRLTLPGMTPDARIDLPPSWHGPEVALAMQAAPVSPNALAVLIGDRGITPPDLGGVAIYDGAARRADTIPGQYPGQMTWLVWGSDDSKLYGVNGSNTGFELFAMNADASGVRLGTTYGAVFFQFHIQIHYDGSTGRVYADDGRVVDPSSGVIVGAFNVRDLSVNACLPDPAQPLVYFLGRSWTRNSVYTLRVFDKNTYRQLGNIEIPQATGEAHNLIRWGRAGLAFNTTTLTPGNGAVYIVDGGLVNPSADPGFTGSQDAPLLPVLVAMAPESAVVGSQDVTLTLSGSEFNPSSQVYWNSQALGTTYHSSTELQAVVPASALVQEGAATISVVNDSTDEGFNSLTFTVLPASSGLITRNLLSLDIAWDAFSSRLYAAVSGEDPLYPNSVVAIDPTDGSMSKPTTVGSDPYILRVSRDGTLGYVGYVTASVATQFHVPALDSPMTWSLGANSFYGPFAAGDIQPAPDSPQTTAISLRSTSGVSPANRGLAIFDNTVARPQQPPVGSRLYNSLQWGLTDSALYAVNNEAGSFELYTLGVNATGATLVRTVGGMISDFHEKIHFDRGTGYLYGDDGYATDPATGSHAGQYGAAGLVVPDSSLNRVFVLTLTSSTPTNTYTISSFDQSRFTLLGSVTIHNVVGKAVAFTRWGSSGLAFVTSNRNTWPIPAPAGMLYILNSPALVNGAR